jgi:hypothetical protein
MQKVEHDLLASKYTEVFQQDKKDQKFNASHRFEVKKAGSEVRLLGVHFQEGPIKENGVNGVNNEDLIAMVLSRLQSFQESEYRCRENAMAITKLEEALLWLRKRTMGREKRGVEGTHIK